MRSGTEILQKQGVSFTVTKLTLAFTINSDEINLQILIEVDNCHLNNHKIIGIKYIGDYWQYIGGGKTNIIEEWIEVIVGSGQIVIKHFFFYAYV